MGKQGLGEMVSGLLGEAQNALTSVFSKGGTTSGSSADMSPEEFRSLISSGPKNDGILSQIQIWESLLAAQAGFDKQIEELQARKTTMDTQRGEMQFQIHKAMYELQQQKLAQENAMGMQQPAMTGMQSGFGQMNMQGYPQQGYPQQGIQQQGMQQGMGQGYPQQGYSQQPGMGGMQQGYPQQPGMQQGMQQGYQQPGMGGMQPGYNPQPFASGYNSQTNPLPGMAQPTFEGQMGSHEEYMGPSASEAASLGGLQKGPGELPSIDPAYGVPTQQGPIMGQGMDMGVTGAMPEMAGGLPNPEAMGVQQPSEPDDAEIEGDDNDLQVSGQEESNPNKA